MKQIRKRHSPAFKAKVALEAAKEIKTLSQLSTEYGVHQVQISKWKKELLETLPSLFTRDDKSGSSWSKERDDLYRQMQSAASPLLKEGAAVD